MNPFPEYDSKLLIVIIEKLFYGSRGFFIGSFIGSGIRS